MRLKRMLQMVLVLSCLLLFIFGCSNKSTTGGSDDITAEASIGPDGGTLLIEDDIVLTIEAGSLADTIDFIITENSSPPALSGALKFVSPVFTIGPSGTDFTSPAIVSITYNQALCGSFPENSIVVYAHNGTSWEALTTSVATSENIAAGSTSHLSDFAAVIDTTIASDGVFAAMAVGRTITNISNVVIKMDIITARFDSSYAPCDPVNPKQAGGVSCNEYDLIWQSGTNSYMYMGDTELEYLDLWDNYVFDISAGNGIPAFKDSIIFPGVEPYVTSPVPYSTASLSGFNVEWENGTDSGYVKLFLLDMSNDTAFYVQTDNDGLYSFDSNALSDFSAGLCSILLITENWDYIDADGIDPRSFIRARVINTTMITLQ